MSTWLKFVLLGPTENPFGTTPPPPTGPTISSQPQNESIAINETATFTVVATGTGTLTYQWQVNIGGTWRDVAASGEGTGMTTASYTTQTGSVLMTGQQYRVEVTDTNGTTTSSAASLTVGGGSVVTGDFWTFDDFAYPTVPAEGTTVSGATVVYVSNRAELDAAIGDNTYIVLADGNYQNESRLNIDSVNNITLHAQNRLGARFAFSNYQTNNGIHISRCDDFQFIGLDFAKSAYYGLRIGADPAFGDVRGPCRRGKVLHCRFRDMSAGCLKIDSGNGSGGSMPAYFTEDIEVAYTEFSQIGQSPPPTNIHFSEGVYIGDGTTASQNRAYDVNIHHCLFDGTDTNNGAGEAIEAKVYCRDIRIADCLIINWMLSDSTSGGAIALSINSGDSGNIPSSGTRGMESYLVERCRVYGTRRFSGFTSFSKAHALTLGHGNSTIRNNIFWDNADGGLRFMQNDVSHTGYFSNPSELGVDLHHNTFLSNPGDGHLSIDDSNPAPTTVQVNSVNNLFSGSESYPTNTVNWVTQDDSWGVTGSAFTGGAITGAQGTGMDHGIGFSPVSDAVLVTSNTTSVAVDILNNTRPNGAAQYGAIDVV